MFNFGTFSDVLKLIKCNEKYPNTWMFFEFGKRTYVNNSFVNEFYSKKCKEYDIK
jgi:hypothetical protein